MLTSAGTSSAQQGWLHPATLDDGSLPNKGHGAPQRCRGKHFEELEIVLGRDLTAGALPCVVLLSETQGGGKSTRGMQAYQVVPPIVDAECAEGVSTWVDHVWSHKEIVTAARP